MSASPDEIKKKNNQVEDLSALLFHLRQTSKLTLKLNIRNPNLYLALQTVQGSQWEIFDDLTNRMLLENKGTEFFFVGK